MPPHTPPRLAFRARLCVSCLVPDNVEWRWLVSPCLVAGYPRAAVSCDA
jgi:hypothetical protein